MAAVSWCRKLDERESAERRLKNTGGIRGYVVISIPEEELIYLAFSEECTKLAMSDSRGDAGSTSSSYRSGSSRRTNGDMRDYMGSDGGRYNKESKYGDPPNSRLFIVCGKSITEDDFRESFSKYGTVTEVWMVKDRATGEPKGKFCRCYIFYILYETKVMYCI